MKMGLIVIIVLFSLSFNSAWGATTQPIDRKEARPKPVSLYLEYPSNCLIDVDYCAGLDRTREKSFNFNNQKTIKHFKPRVRVIIIKRNLGNRK